MCMENLSGVKILVLDIFTVKIKNVINVTLIRL